MTSVEALIEECVSSLKSFLQSFPRQYEARPFYQVSFTAKQAFLLRFINFPCVSSVTLSTRIDQKCGDWSYCSMEVAAGIIAVVQITEEVGKLCGNYIQGVRHAQRDIERLQSKAEALHGVLTTLNNKPQANIKSEAVQKCCEDLKSIRERLQPRKKKKNTTLQRIGLTRALKWPFTSKETKDHVDALSEYAALFGTTITLDVHDKTSDAEQDRLLDKLAYAGDALFNSYENEQRHRMCLENTRVEVLQEAMEWAADDSSRCIFWLKGLAGTGKSTIANTVAFRLKAGTRPVATFFFKRGHGDLAHVRKLIPTIARQLSIASPLYKQAIVTVIKKEPDLGSSANFREQ